MKNNLCEIVNTTAMMLVLMVIGVSAQIATGGTYTLKQSVIANGGGRSTDAVNNNYTVTGTSGEPAAGTNPAGGNYSARNGFWGAVLAPTAAGASISGRVITENGNGIQNVIVTLIGGNLTTPRIVRTGSFGYFKFEDAEVGQVYVISVTSKRYGFFQSSQIVTLQEDLTDIVFQANWVN